MGIGIIEDMMMCVYKFGGLTSCMKMYVEDQVLISDHWKRTKREKKGLKL